VKRIQHTPTEYGMKTTRLCMALGYKKSSVFKISAFSYKLQDLLDVPGMVLGTYVRTHTNAINRINDAQRYSYRILLEATGIEFYWRLRTGCVRSRSRRRVHFRPTSPPPASQPIITPVARPSLRMTYVRYHRQSSQLSRSLTFVPPLQIR
jgi:hypothetical protein